MIRHGPRLISKIGNVRRFHSGSALVAYAGLDAPPFQSGTFTGTNRHISKRGSFSGKDGFDAFSEDQLGASPSWKSGDGRVYPAGYHICI